MTLLTVNVEEAHGAALELGILNAELRQAFLYETGQLARLGDAAEVSFHIGHEAWHARLAESFCNYLEGNGFTCAGGSGDESVAASHFAHKRDGTV